MDKTTNRLGVYLTGGIIYMTGDSIAALITGEWSALRSLGLFLTGSTLYAWEIQQWFSWIERRMSQMPNPKKMALKTMLALAYFNPLWIARHLCIVYLFSGKANLVSLDLLQTASWAFLVNIPVSIVANFAIQNKISIKYRFWSSAIFSGLMAIYYSMSSTWF